MTNEVQIIYGRMSNNPNLKYTPKGEAVCEFSVMLPSENEKPLWQNIVVWGKQAEFCNLYLKKDSRIFAIGQPHCKTYKDKKTGEDKVWKEFKAYDIGFTWANENKFAVDT